MAAPTSIPAARARPGLITAFACPGRRRAMISPSTPRPAASPSMCAPPSTAHSISGLTVHSRWARARAAGSARSSRSSASAITAKASANSSFSQKMMRPTEVPPSFAAPHCAAVASGPYSDGSVCQLRVVCRPTGSPLARSCRGVIW